MEMLADFFKRAWKVVAAIAKVFCEFLCRRCNPSAYISHHHYVPEKEIYLSEELEILVDNQIEERRNTITSLPEELIINILSRLPAQLLHESVRSVCMRWEYLVNDPFFIEAHLRQAKTGIFIEVISSPANFYFFETKGGEFSFSLTYYKHEFPGRMIASYDGIALFIDLIDITILYVMNPVTMEKTRLPSLDEPPNPLYYSSCIARGRSTRQYKVVHSYEDLSREYHWVVLTIGIDNSWRRISSEQTFMRGDMELDNFPVSVSGVIYWTDYDYEEEDGIVYFPAMDVDDETIRKVPIPPSGSIEPCAYTKMGNYLSGFVTAPLSLQFEIYVLKDWLRGEWDKVYEIHIDAPRGLYFYFPIGWLNDDEMLVLEGLTMEGDIYMAYDVKKNETRVLDLSICGPRFYSHVHTNTLVSYRMP
ncbi:putative F-box protein At3g49980 [Camellia sinensis]|uniref:putative F-box protein At3g49980 n=1 Tax=Camellia sinensis TaxID=4442 RepID=UPI001035563B|nr:putative F-box protein At3g49980 [Camellia sinensis]